LDSWKREKTTTLIPTIIFLKSMIQTGDQNVLLRFRLSRNNLNQSQGGQIEALQCRLAILKAFQN
jgi:hypothetical protein